MLNRSLIIIKFRLSSEPRGYKNGKGVRASASKELCKGPERRRELIIGQGRRDAAENKEASNDEGWGRKDGYKCNGGEGGRPAKSEWSGAEEVVGLRDCCAFILLCSRLLKHHLRKRLLSRVTAALR